MNRSPSHQDVLHPNISRRRARWARLRGVWSSVPGCGVKLARVGVAPVCRRPCFTSYQGNPPGRRLIATHNIVVPGASFICQEVNLSEIDSENNARKIWNHAWLEIIYFLAFLPNQWFKDRLYQGDPQTSRSHPWVGIPTVHSTRSSTACSTVLATLATYRLILAQ